MMPLADIQSEIAVAADAEAHPEARLEAAGRAKALIDGMVEAQGAPDQRKGLQALMAEIAAARPLVNRTYRHRRSGELYVLIFIAFNERNNEAKACYGSAALPALKFERPLSEFLASFEEDHGHAPRG